MHYFNLTDINSDNLKNNVMSNESTIIKSYRLLNSMFKCYFSLSAKKSKKKKVKMHEKTGG